MEIILCARLALLLLHVLLLQLLILLQILALEVGLIIYIIGLGRGLMLNVKNVKELLMKLL
jgi:hypothetical protein